MKEYYHILLSYRRLRREERLTNHPLASLQIFSSALASSATAQYRSSVEIIVNPPLVGIVILASMAIIVLVAPILSN